MRALPAEKAALVESRVHRKKRIELMFCAPLFLRTKIALTRPKAATATTFRHDQLSGCIRTAFMTVGAGSS